MAWDWRVVYVWEDRSLVFVWFFFWGGGEHIYSSLPRRLGAVEDFSVFFFCLFVFKIYLFYVCEYTVAVRYTRRGH